jgi:hypothetical protein
MELQSRRQPSSQTLCCPYHVRSHHLHFRKFQEKQVLKFFSHLQRTLNDMSDFVSMVKCQDISSSVLLHVLLKKFILKHYLS